MTHYANNDLLTKFESRILGTRSVPSSRMKAIELYPEEQPTLAANKLWSQLILKNYKNLVERSCAIFQDSELLCRPIWLYTSSTPVKKEEQPTCTARARAEFGIRNKHESNHYHN